MKCKSCGANQVHWRRLCISCSHYEPKKSNTHTHRKCNNCFEIKALNTNNFNRKLDGFQHRCKACNNEVVTGYRKRKTEKDIQKRWDELYKQDRRVKA